MNKYYLERSNHEAEVAALNLLCHIYFLRNDKYEG